MDFEKDFIKDVSAYLPSALEKAILKIPAKQRQNLQEIRFKAGQPVMLTIGGSSFFLSSEKVTSSTESAIITSAFELEQIFKRFCQNSVYTFQNDIANGFVTIKNGHRVGLAGTCVIDQKGNITGIRNLSSLCVRFAKEIKGCADSVMPQILYDGRIHGTFLISPPKCGKTTMLRDIARQLSSRFFRVCVIDERSEIAAMYQGCVQNDLGPCCDVLDGFQKSIGMMYAVRNLSPQVILCDEIGNNEDVESILHAMNAGIPVIATAHAQSPEEAFQRPWFSKLLSSYAIEQLFFLDSGKIPGTVNKIYKMSELMNEADRNCIYHTGGNADGYVSSIQSKKISPATTAFL